MRILWVEDLGEIIPDQLVGYLRGWLEDSEIDDVAFALENNIRNLKSEFWLDYYNENRLSNDREVHYCIQLSDLKKVISTRDTIKYYDVILIDINLEDNFFGFENHWPEGIDPKRAGLWIYNRLVRLGFPPDRLIFITGNAVDEAENFIENCRKNYIEPEPKFFDKGEIKENSQNETKLQIWLNHVEGKNEKFIILRRGIIDGCKYIYDQLEIRGEDFIQFNEFCNNDSGARQDVESIKDYLILVLNTLPTEIHCENSVQLQLRCVLRVIAHEWENGYKSENLSRKFENNDLRWLKALGYVMKTARNLLSHSNKLNNANVCNVAFLFLINCRAMFLLGDELKLHEKKLLNLFKIELVERDMIKKDLKKNYFLLKDIYSEYVGTSMRDGTKVESTRFYNLMVLRLAQVVDPPEINYSDELYRILFFNLYEWDHKKKCYIVNYNNTSSINIFWKKQFIESFYHTSFSDVKSYAS